MTATDAGRIHYTNYTGVTKTCKTCDQQSNIQQRNIYTKQLIQGLGTHFCYDIKQAQNNFLLLNLITLCGFICIEWIDLACLEAHRREQTITLPYKTVP